MTNPLTTARRLQSEARAEKLARWEAMKRDYPDVAEFVELVARRFGKLDDVTIERTKP